MPTAQLPCLTASMAYSTWNSLPCGLQVVMSVSYCTHPEIQHWCQAGTHGCRRGYLASLASPDYETLRQQRSGPLTVTAGPKAEELDG